MKKQILAGLLIISSLSFSAPKNVERPIREHRQCEYNYDFHKASFRKFKHLSPELQKEVKVTRLDIAEKKIAVKRLLLEDKIDWVKVGNLNKEIALLRADLKTKCQKYFVENPLPNLRGKVQIEERQ